MVQSWRALKSLRYILLVAAVSLLIYVIAQVGFGQIVQYLSTIHRGWLLLTFVFMAVNIFFATLRFRCLIMTNLSFVYFLKVFLASFLLNYAAMVQGLGLAAKLGMLKTQQVPISHSSASILLEICFDILVCSCIIAVLLFIKIGAGLESSTVFAIPLIFVAAVGLSLVVVHRFPGRFELADQFLTALREIGSVPRLSLTLFYTIGIWVSTGAGLYCILNAFQAGPSTDLGLSILAMTSGFLTGLVSLVPGGIGVRELTWSYIVSWGGYPLELAGLAAVFYRISAIFLVSVILAVMSFKKPSAS